MISSLDSAIAVITRSCHLDWTSPFFTEAQARPIVLTTSGTDDAIAQASEAADGPGPGQKDGDARPP
jgi:hypothetical protein